ncbi:hypothetical protein [Sphingopyxis sp. PET50]|uniref:hypothetical protein n=1 Tax=Sphingopyxis sp. PET50 TaxID=2976533 RepID=UPI0021AEF4C5|nr:hypothetical protein [Sphingopyxis sp. PET50]
MSRPDLTDAEARAAYRRELRGVARWPRLAGFVLILGAVGLWAWPRSGGPWFLGPLPTQTWAWISLGLGWAIWIGVIVARTRHHRARMAEPGTGG